MADTRRVAGRRNILLIVCDQLRADALGFAGSTAVRTPAIDALAASGLAFRRCYTTSAVCVPARASLSTGRYATAHRVFWNETPWPADEKLMGSYLAELGSTSYQCGKAHYTVDRLSGQEPLAGRQAHLGGKHILSPFPDMATLEWNDGWNLGDEYCRSLAGRGYPAEFASWPHQVVRPDGGLERWKHDGSNSHLRCALDAEDTDTAFTARRAIDFLSRVHEEPWMLFLSFYRPHQPYCPSAPYYGMCPPESMPDPIRSDAELERSHLVTVHQRAPYLELMRGESYWRWMRSAYHGLVAELDLWIGRVLDALSGAGLRDRTLVLLTSDHGDYLGDHWLFGKESFYDQAHRVPLVVVDPSSAADSTRGRSCDAWVQLVDVLPTMLEWLEPAGSAPESRSWIQGRSVLDFVHGREARGWRQAAYASWEYRAYWRGEPDRSPECPRCLGIRDERYNYWYLPGLDDVLFDLERDPLELENVASRREYEGVVARSRARLLEHAMGAADTRRVDWRFS